jgi:hypothetical protein
VKNPALFVGHALSVDPDIECLGAEPDRHHYWKSDRRDRFDSASSKHNGHQREHGAGS